MENESQNQPSQDNAVPFDEKPIGGGTNPCDISEYPPGTMPITADFNPDIECQVKKEPLPLIKRVNSKLWKTREEAF
jgi:hypothetical protein